jgi:biopolymer transport protein ExbD
MAGGGGGEEGEFGLQIAPMLDILFVLLLFFMVSAGTQKKERNLSSPLPGSGAPDPTAPVPMNININANDEVTMNGSPYNVIMVDSKKPSELQLKLTGIIQDNDQQPIVINPSPLAHHQAVMDVLNACTGAGVKNVAFMAVQGAN